MTFKNKTVLVAGMGLSGAASSELLSSLGANLILHDAKQAQQLSEATLSTISGLQYEDYIGRDASDALHHTDIVVVSPGLPPDMPLLMKAHELGIPIIAEIELGYQLQNAPGSIIAITGTNGKTTTTALTGAIFANSGRKTFVLGNIGMPFTSKASQIRAGDAVVVETAALQLDHIHEYRPVVSAILNITPDHLDRYVTMERYAAAKARVFENQTADDWCVLNRDDNIVRSLARNVRARILWFALKPSNADGLYAENGDIVIVMNGQKTVLMRTDEVKIPGAHNLQNALAAAAIALCQGISPHVVIDTLRTFPGVEHRIETVCEKNGILFINDSKGTNPDATIKAVDAMKRPVILILGGFDKHADFEPLMRAVSNRVKHVVVLGETADRIVAAASACGFKRIERADSFDSAVHAAERAADSGDVVLLSPACASWDMFSNFEERGQRFKEIVREVL